METVGSRALWRATLLALSFTVVLGVLLAAAGQAATAALGPGSRLVIGLALAFVLPLLWLWLFYREDRLEPEPHAYVLGVFLVGALLGGAVQQPILREVFDVQLWIRPGSWTHLGGAVFLNGIFSAGLTYLAVRFTVLPTAEFDEQVDGIIYGTAAALGLGVPSNLAYLLENSTISLGVGALDIVITSLAYATFGAIVGYFLGLVRLGGAPAWLVPAGVLTAGVLHGIYDWGESQLGWRSLAYNPWPAFIVTVLFTAAAFGVVFALIQRSHTAMLLTARKTHGR